MNDPSIPITIIILNYNGADDTIQCVNSLLQHLPEDPAFEIVVVDNKSTDDSLSVIQSAFVHDEITVISSKENAGFAAGNNIGIRYALEKGEGFICLLNSDTVAVSDFLTPCINVLKEDRSAAFVSPGIVDHYSGKFQNTGLEISLMRTHASFINNDVTPDSSLPERINCDMVSGCCMVFHTSLIEKIGFLPEYYFMYFEETEWCWKAKKKRYHAVSLPGIGLLHKGRVSFTGKNELYDYLYERNRVVFAKRCMNRLQFIVFLFYDFLKCFYRAHKEKVPLRHFLHPHIDGLKNRVDPSIFTIPNAVWRTDV